MPMPTEHRKQATALAKSAQDLSKLIRNAKFRAALDEFHDNPKARKTASRDTTGYLKRRGVKIPEEMEITLRDNNWSVTVCASILIFKVCVRYDSTSGFRVM
jgi:hypothetical protein